MLKERPCRTGYRSICKQICWLCKWEKWDWRFQMKWRHSQHWKSFFLLLQQNTTSPNSSSSSLNFLSTFVFLSTTTPSATFCFLKWQFTPRLPPTHKNHTHTESSQHLYHTGMRCSLSGRLESTNQHVSTHVNIYFCLYIQLDAAMIKHNYGTNLTMRDLGVFPICCALIISLHCVGPFIMIHCRGRKKFTQWLSKAHSAPSYNIRLEIYIIKSQYGEMGPSPWFIPLLSVREDECSRIKAITTNNVWRRWMGRRDKEEGGCSGWSMDAWSDASIF